MRLRLLWSFVSSAILFTACSAFAPTPTPTPVSTPTRHPETPTPALSANILPDAEQSYTEVAGGAPFTVTFTAGVSGGVPPYAYEWDFDGDTKTDSTAASPPPFIYDVAQVYNAASTVTDADNQRVQVAWRIVAFAPPEMPDLKYGITAHLERLRPTYYPTLEDVASGAVDAGPPGIQSVRMDFNWDMLNPTRDEWKFEDYDKVVQIWAGTRFTVFGNSGLCELVGLVRSRVGRLAGAVVFRTLE